MALIESLEQQQGFTKTESTIADYILAHLSDVTNMTIVELAEATYTSRSAVLRLCRKTGSTGYRAFRVELARELERANSSFGEIDPNRPFVKGSTTDQIVRSLALLGHQAIDDAASVLDLNEVRRAGRLISQARRVALYGVGDTMATLEVFSALLIKSGIVCVRGYDANDRFALGGFLDANDVVVLASYTGINLKEFERQLAGPLARRCKVILVTSDVSAREQLLGADCLIRLPAGEHHENQGAYYSQESMRFALGCVYGEVVAQTWETTEAVRQRVLLEDEEHAARKGESDGA